MNCPNCGKEMGVMDTASTSGADPCSVQYRCVPCGLTQWRTPCVTAEGK